MLLSVDGNYVGSGCENLFRKGVWFDWISRLFFQLPPCSAHFLQIWFDPTGLWGSRRQTQWLLVLRPPQRLSFHLSARPPPVPLEMVSHYHPHHTSSAPLDVPRVSITKQTKKKLKWQSANINITYIYMPYFFTGHGTSPINKDTSVVCNFVVTDRLCRVEIEV